MAVFQAARIQFQACQELMVLKRVEEREKRRERRMMGSRMILVSM